MLTQYQTQTSQLLQNPAAPTPLYATALLTSFINTARGQLAGVEGKCIRQLGSLVLTPGQPVYPFTSINVGTQVTTGIAGVVAVNHMLYGVGGGLQWFRPRAWERFIQYVLNNPTPKPGPPARWAQYGQGAAPPPALAGTGAVFWRHALHRSAAGFHLHDHGGLHLLPTISAAILTSRLFRTCGPTRCLILLLIWRCYRRRHRSECRKR